VSVVIPAHDEARVITANLRTLLSSAAPAELDVLVVCNGCTDDTAGLARAVLGVRVAEIDRPSKWAAMVRGDELARYYPRLYLDADVSLSTDAARRLAAAVEEPGVLAAGPRRVVPLDGVSWLVRAYYSVWQRLPEVRDGLFGRGVIAVSAAGHGRIRALPPAMSDDLAVHRSFAPLERRIVLDATVTVRPPRTAKDLLRRRIRALQGVRQLSRLAPADGSGTTSLRDLLTLFRERPASAPSLLVFLGYAVAARLALRLRPGLAGQTWLRDESSRT
jgi:cellulose synthase/poly-beta-1,6-N-acetylglucosamine synthase-like glycosyltransferase